MRPTVATLTGLTSLAAVAASARLFSEEDPDVGTACLYTGSPYLVHCGLAYANRRVTDVSALILAATLLSGLAAFVVYYLDTRAHLAASSQGLEISYCGSPGGVILMPVAQWLFAGCLGIFVEAVNRSALPDPDPAPRFAGGESG